MLLTLRPAVGEQEDVSCGRSAAERIFVRRLKAIVMIYESHPWRADLKRFARTLANARTMTMENESESARVERAVMYGFFALRKLEESDKLTKDTQSQTLKWHRFPAIIGKRMPRHKRQELDDYFDMLSPERVQLSPRELANQVIHSYVFTHLVDSRDRLRGVFVASDRGRKRGVLYLPAWRIVLLFRRVASDIPTYSSWTYDPKSGEYLYYAESRARK